MASGHVYFKCLSHVTENRIHLFVSDSGPFVWIFGLDLDMNEMNLGSALNFQVAINWFNRQLLSLGSQQDVWPGLVLSRMRS